MRYLYKGAVVYPMPGQTFDSHMNVKDIDGNIISVSPDDLATIQEVQLERPSPPFQDLPIRPLIEDDASQKPTLVNDKEVVAQLDQSFKKDSPVLEINKFKETDIPSLSRQLPGIGKVTLKKLFANRPESGYESISQIKEMDIGNIRWDDLSDYIVF